MTTDNPRLHIAHREPQPAETFYTWREPTLYPFKLGVLLDSLHAAQAEGAPDNANVHVQGDAVSVSWSVVEEG